MVSFIKYFNGMTVFRVFILLSFLFLAGCAAPHSQTESLDYRSRAETLVEGGVSVSAVVLSPQEARNSFSLPLDKKKIQPVWIEIENKEDKEFYLMLLSIDPDYFAPSEVAWMFRRYGEVRLADRIDELVDKHIPIVIPPLSTVSGYVYTHLDPGGKAFSIELFGKQDHRHFEFVQGIPGFRADFMRVDFEQLYTLDEIQDLDLPGLRHYLENLPPYVLGGDRKTPGDPLNLVIVGDGLHVLATLVRRGWDFTETVRPDTVWRTIASSAFGSHYRTSPVSPLYFFERSHDFALQKARSTVDERNHLRLWLAPVSLNGRAVWVGQISRDIGLKLTSKTFVTHKIDPVVDEARLYITLDMIASETFEALGYVKGVGYSDRDAPRYNYTKDPYYTDGLRVVLILGEDWQAIADIDYLPWEKAGATKRSNR